MSDAELLLAHKQLCFALQLLRDRASASPDSATPKALLIQCDLLQAGWSHIEKYCEEVRQALELPGAGVSLADLAGMDTRAYATSTGLDPDWVARGAKMGEVFGWIDQLAAGHDLESCRVGLMDAVRQIKWKPRAQTPLEMPGDNVLTCALRHALGGEVKLLGRRSLGFFSTFPSEILDLYQAGAGMRHVLVKYEFKRFRERSGHRGGPSYEAAVYGTVLRNLKLTVPVFLGARDTAADGTWLFLEFVDGAVRPDDLPSPAAGLKLGARWAASFHETAPASSLLKRYDATYYSSWPRRAYQGLRMWRDRYPWLDSFLQQAPELLEALASGPACVIHGEFTPHNLLVRGDSIYPVDWESAAIGAGEIDLASLTDGWPMEIAEACEREYAAARWPQGAPPEFAERLALARLYWGLRWLGNTSDGEDWLSEEHVLGRAESLRRTGVRLGIL